MLPIVSRFLGPVSAGVLLSIEFPVRLDILNTRGLGLVRAAAATLRLHWVWFTGRTLSLFSFISILSDGEKFSPWPLPVIH